MRKIILIIILGFLSTAARNPFEPTYLPPEIKKQSSLDDFFISSIQLKAVVWGLKENIALFETHGGETFIAKVGTKIGKKGGKVTKIDDNIVIVKGPVGKVTFNLNTP